MDTLRNDLAELIDNQNGKICAASFLIVEDSTLSDGLLSRTVHGLKWSYAGTMAKVVLEFGLLRSCHGYFTEKTFERRTTQAYKTETEDVDYTASSQWRPSRSMNHYRRCVLGHWHVKEEVQGT